MGFARENDYDAIIARESAATGVPFALIKAIIAAESNFTPSAFRGEAKIEDASRGLMQLLGSTARALGYTGPIGDDGARTGGLYDPATNIHLGAKLLRGLLQRGGGSVPNAVSAYNGGFRPSLGFGSPATRTVTVCLARDASGTCVKTFTAKPGQYGNQAYVDRVLGFAARYGATDMAPSVIRLDGPHVVDVDPGVSLAPSQAAPLLPQVDAGHGATVAKVGAASLVAGAVVWLAVMLARRLAHVG